MRDYYGNSHAYNVGYWGLGAKNQAEASRDLVLHLIAPVAAKPARILDVACGLGETTGYLKQRWPEAEVTGINFSAGQIAECRVRHPDCTFFIMDATELDFPPDSFDLVVCVEAAMHFPTRQKFLAEVARVLVPGGTLVMSDMLFTSVEALAAWHVPIENYITDLYTYRAEFASSGLMQVVVEDHNDLCWRGFCRNMAHWLDHSELASRHPEAAQAWHQNLAPLEAAVAFYPLTWAKKPLNQPLESSCPSR
jgi:SAM-dependent methyltransferase